MKIKSQSLKFFFLLVILPVLFGILAVSPALAQCGDIPADSSCLTCHETQAVNPVVENGEWHKIHASKDCCWNCHGGNTQAQDKELAHAGMTTHPLSDIYTDCYSCHPNDFSERADRFAAALGVTAFSAPTVTPAPAEARIAHTMLVDQPAAPIKATADTNFLMCVALISAAILLFIIAITILRMRQSASA